MRAAKDKAKIGGFAALRGFNYTTRANIAHEKAEQIRARIACTPAYIGAAGVGLVCAWTEQSACFLFWILVALEFYLVGELTHMRSMCVGVAETGVAHLSPLKKQSKSATIGCRLAL